MRVNTNFEPFITLSGHVHVVTRLQNWLDEVINSFKITPTITPPPVAYPQTPMISTQYCVEGKVWDPYLVGCVWPEQASSVSQQLADRTASGQRSINEAYSVGSSMGTNVGTQLDNSGEINWVVIAAGIGGALLLINIAGKKKGRRR